MNGIIKTAYITKAIEHVTSNIYINIYLYMHGLFVVMYLII